MNKSAKKVLSENDLGKTNSHQAGILIPKSLVSAGVFDSLSTTVKNPRVQLRCWDSSLETYFFPNYIFYNNKYFSGTRSEYRMTGLSAYFRETGLRPGDLMIFTRTAKFEYTVDIERCNRKAAGLSEESWKQIYES
jgi:hypothetical protein